MSDQGAVVGLMPWVHKTPARVSCPQPEFSECDIPGRKP